MGLWDHIVLNGIGRTSNGTDSLFLHENEKSSRLFMQKSNFSTEISAQKKFLHWKKYLQAEICCNRNSHDI